MPDTNINSSGDLDKDRDYLNRRYNEMDREYKTFEPHFKQLSEFIDPRRGRYFVEDRNKGDKRFKNIINNRATKALRKATAGMMAGAMSPSRPWFVWTLMDTDLLEDEGVKNWLSLFQRLILMVLSKSNAYNMAPLMLRELLLFGTGCMTHVDDFDDIARFYTHTIGSYRIAQNHKLKVDTLGREFQMTAIQMVRKFGLDKVSVAVKSQYDRGNYEGWFTVRHLIELNPKRDSSELGSEFMPFRSVYWEKNTKSFLSRKGFEGFPAYVPRWELAGEDIYSVNCPGMTNLGDIKQLQQQEKEKAKAIAKAGTPPLQGPPNLRNQPVANMPGGLTINSSNQKIESIYSVDPRIQEMLFDINSTEDRIDEGFFVDMFMAITDMKGIQPKNELQLSQINQERLLQIGPVLEQVHGEWLDRMVRRVAKQILDADIMPPAPEALQGRELDVEFVSALAMAQRSVTTSAIERTVNFAGQMTEAGFDVRDKINGDRAIEDYAGFVGAPTKIIVPDDEVAAIRQKRAEEEQRAKQIEMATQAANAMKIASDSKLGDENVLSRAVDQQQ